MTQRGPQPPPRRPVTVPAAACCGAAGIALGLTASGGITPWTAFAAAATAAAGAAWLAIARLPAPPPPAAPHDRTGDPPRDTADLAVAVGGSSDPDAALGRMLQVIAGAAGSDTALLLSLREGGTVLVLESPLLLAGSVVDAGAEGAVPVAESGPARVALAAGVPMASPGPGDDPGRWHRFLAVHAVDAAWLVPLTADRPVGLVVVAAPAAGTLRHPPARLRALAPAAGGAVGAMLRLRELSRTTVEGARMARFRADYASVVGHELRTPLTTILGVVKTLSRPELAPSNPDARDLLGMAEAQGDRLKRLVEDMLALSQIDGDGVPVRPELVTLPDLIERAIDRVPGAADLTTVDVPPSLPPVVVDPEHTGRALRNLLSNAVKYGEGSAVEVRAAARGGTLEISVVDRGPGMPPEAAAAAFDAFTQLRRTEVDGYGGMGLGLSVARGLLEVMDGTLRHEPTPGGGATFVIGLPFRPHAGGARSG